MRSVIAHHQKSTLPSGRHDFVGAEGEGRRIAECAYLASVDCCPMGLGTVLNQEQLVPVAEIGKRGHIAWPSCQMHTDHRLCPRRDHSFNRDWIDILRRG